MPSVRTLLTIALALSLTIILIYLMHSLYMLRVGSSLSNQCISPAEYEDLMNNYSNLLTKYAVLLQKLNECLVNESSIPSQPSLSHSETIASGLILNATLPTMSCNGYTLQSMRSLYFETKGPGYLVITYRLSNPQVIEGSVSYYVYVMAQAVPSIPMTAMYTYEGSTYAYEAGQYGRLIIPVLPNSTYVLTLGFTCYATQYYPPTNAGAVINGEIPERAIVNVTYVW